jgi:hypothetical protein
MKVVRERELVVVAILATLFRGTESEGYKWQASSIAL